MIDSVGEYASINGKINEIADINDAELNGKNVVYEVIRVVKGVPLFFEDHYSRMRNSLEMVGNKLMITEQDFISRIKDVIDANGMQDCNIRAIVYQDFGHQNLIIYIRKSYYPSMEEVEKGIKVNMLNWDRNNPNLKIQNLEYKDAVKRKLEEENVFETLLVNAGGKITEGSRSNVFFVKKTKIYTAPDEYILKGVVRKYIIDMCRRLGIEVIETLISVESLYEMEGLFITGTPIKVLPVSNVEGHAFDSSNHPVVVSIRNGFDSLVDEYVRERLLQNT
jgi:branched-chain amino acid aminotransferase